MIDRRRLALLPLLPGVAAAADFRTEDYRAPTPANVPGGTAIDTDAARALFAQPGVVWIDVLPRPRRPDRLPPDSLWLPSKRLGIPGSLWLPEAGRGELASDIETWFRATLAHATGGDPGRTLVFYCLADCWLSWNAAKRAAEWGYTRVHWYRDGTDGWEAAGLPTAVLHPAPGAP